MTTQEASDKLKEILKDRLWGCGDYSEAMEVAIRSLEADRKIEKILYDIRNEITMLFIFDREPVIEIIDKHIKEVEDDTGRA